MGTLYKRSFSNLEILRFSPSKLARVYSIIVLISAIICSYLSYRAIAAFTATDTMPEDKAQFFQDNQSMLIYFLNLSFIAMMVFSNLHSFASKKISWLLYLQTFGIYAAFAIIDNFFLQDTFFHFKKMNQLWQGEFSFANIVGYLSLLISAGLTLFNAYMTYWGLMK
jgi:phosphate starvation-inducible membrane PsiE